MINIDWNNLTSAEQLSEIDEISKNTPVLIFKHSTRCSISSASLHRLERHWDESKGDVIRPYFLDLIAHRDISNAVAERYGVMHQSPQVLLIQEGKCIYNNSHFGISFEEILQNVQLPH